MGYFQADTQTLHLTGVGMYGQMGASGSRKLEGGKYYSDHPSVYLRVESQQLLEEASDTIMKRKILRVKKSMQL